MIGLGTIGRNFLLNIAEHKFTGVGYDIDKGKHGLLEKDAGGLPLSTSNDLADLAPVSTAEGWNLRSRRRCFALRPAGTHCPALK